jgi:RNA polymerase sigma-70 factor (ECF subfamily)
MKYVAAGIIGKMSDAEDIVQQAYSIAIEKNQSFDSRDQFLGWLVGVVKYCALNVRRKRARRKTTAVDPADMQSFVVDSSSTETASTIDAKNLESLKGSFDDEVVRALGNISDDARTCLLLKTVENMSYKEIATLMQIPEGTAMSMVHRARTSLRKELAGHDFAQTSDVGKGRIQ